MADGDTIIRIKTEYDGKGAADAKKGVESVSAAAQKTGSDGKTAAGGLSRAWSGFGKTVQTVGRAVGTVTRALGLVGFAVSAVQMAIGAYQKLKDWLDRDKKAAEELAKQCGLSEPHFRRVFREYVSMPPIDYLNSVRIREACRMMDRRDCPMDLVASDCGFSSVSSFTRNFRKFMGTTPYQWKLQREKHENRLRDYSITLLKGWSQN